jgi:hypothetical protein
MERKALGKTGLTVSRVGLGLLALALPLALFRRLEPGRNGPWRRWPSR